MVTCGDGFSRCEGEVIAQLKMLKVIPHRGIIDLVLPDGSKISFPDSASSAKDQAQHVQAFVEELDVAFHFTKGKTQGETRWTASKTSKAEIEHHQTEIDVLPTDPGDYVSP